MGFGGAWIIALPAVHGLGLLQTCLTIVRIAAYKQCCKAVMLVSTDFCELPSEVVDYLEPWDKAIVQAAQDLKPGPELLACLRAVQEVLRSTCVALQHELAVPERPWQDLSTAWDSYQKKLLQGASSGCKLPRMLTAALLPGLSEQFSMLVRGASPSRQWLYSFQSTWRMALKLLEFLQVMSLDGFDWMSDLAYDLHRRAFRKAGQSEAATWAAVARAAPAFKLAGHFGAWSADEAASLGAALRHDLPANRVVDAAVRGRKASRRFRMVEVGVFQGNLTQHIWQRSARLPGAFELHLVDHWGAADQPMGAASQAVGTGSDMAGQSNDTSMRAVWRHFGRHGARRVEVPHWLGLSKACATLADAQRFDADVAFHRSTSVGPSRCFEDDSLDLVYIDADHKWWSVLQDLSAWWPKVRPGGLMMGHDFHFNTLMEREELDEGSINDVPIAVAAFFRAPSEVLLHSGFVWSVQKSKNVGSNTSEVSLQRQELCELLRRRLKPHFRFEICDLRP
ncbi:unnamed protein product [Symbiodinium natans]|uniref:Mycinamicin VI 2''-O-methyltransferase n=1 Tax=Symbiodinium natans TaxID=878477 RepID=A0A812KW26_9DINO|nr:unnamed protein product [Symbiodinium natans]